MLVSCTSYAADSAKQADPFANDTDRISYVLGMDLGGYLKSMDIELNLDVFYKGLLATYKGENPLVSPEDAERIKQEFAQKRQAEEQKKLGRQEGPRAQTRKEPGQGRPFSWLGNQKKEQGVKGGLGILGFGQYGRFLREGPRGSSPGFPKGIEGWTWWKLTGGTPSIGIGTKGLE